MERLLFDKTRLNFKPFGFFQKDTSPKGSVLAPREE